LVKRRLQKEHQVAPTRWEAGTKGISRPGKRFLRVRWWGYGRAKNRRQSNRKWQILFQIEFLTFRRTHIGSDESAYLGRAATG